MGLSVTDKVAWFYCQSVFGDLFVCRLGWYSLRCDECPFLCLSSYLTLHFLLSVSTLFFFFFCLMCLLSVFWSRYLLGTDIMLVAPRDLFVPFLPITLGKVRWTLTPDPMVWRLLYSPTILDPYGVFSPCTLGGSIWVIMYSRSTFTLFLVHFALLLVTSWWPVLIVQVIPVAACS